MGQADGRSATHTHPQAGLLIGGRVRPYREEAGPR